MRFSLNRSERSCFIPIYENDITSEDSTEFVIPDVYEDVGKILDIRGQVMITSDKTMNPTSSLEAVVFTNVLYLSEIGDKIECVSTEIPFVFDITEAGLEENTELLTRFFLCDIEAKPLSARKILFRAKVMAKISAFSIGRYSVCNEPAQEAEQIKIHYLKKQSEHSLLSALREKTFAISDEYVLPDMIDKSAELLFTQSSVIVDEVKSVGSKLVFKAKILTDAVLLSEKDKTDLKSVKFETEFSQIIESELNDKSIEALIYTNLISADFVRLPVGNEASFAASYRISATATCLENIGFDYLSDAYSNSSQLMLERDELNIYKVKQAKILKIRAEGRINDSNIASELSYLSVSFVNTEVDNENILVDAVLRGTARGYTNELMPIEVKLRGNDKLSLDHGETIEILGIRCGEVEMSPDGSLSVDLVLTFILKKSCAINFISAINYDENSIQYGTSRPSLTVLCSKAGDTDLWSIAKKYGSTIEAIEGSNISDGVFLPDKRPLLIPKAR